MKMDDSHQLLADYVKNGSESAFRRLVSRHINAVHSTALRLVNGDTHLAEDVTQIVFVDLARKAHSLASGVLLGGWLHRDTCFVAGTILRGERRRHFRERQVAAMNVPVDHTATNLASIAPILDEAINQLEPVDRMAILLRFFEQLEFRAVGEKIGANEDAARMRVNRALDKLHALLKYRGLAFSAAALATALSVGFVSAAPLTLASTVAGAALASVADNGVSATFLKYITIAKFKTAMVGAIAVAVLAVFMVMQHRELREENQALQLQRNRIALLQLENQRLSSLVVEASTRVAPTEQEVREIARLRNEVTRLRQQRNVMVNTRVGQAQNNSHAGQPFNNITMTEFARFIGGVLQAPVIDQTGLTGTYDIDITPPRPGRIDRLLERTKTILNDELGLKLVEFNGPFSIEEAKFDWAPRIKRHADGSYSELDFRNYIPKPDGLYTRLADGTLTNIAPSSDTPSGGFAIKLDHSGAPGLKPATGKLGPNTGLYDSFTQGIPGQIANKLMSLDNAKQSWAFKQGKQDTDTPTWDDVQPYLGSGAGSIDDYTNSPDGEYIIRSVAEKALLRLGPNAEAAWKNGRGLTAARPLSTLPPVEQCINNLRRIDAAKQEWAVENRKEGTDTPTMEDLKEYIHGPGLNCPDGGHYILGNIEAKPDCSVPGHVLP
jgi:RNA polymerase sigma factor (sigma-70 family)